MHIVRPPTLYVRVYLLPWSRLLASVPVSSSKERSNRSCAGGAGQYVETDHGIVFLVPL